MNVRFHGYPVSDIKMSICRSYHHTWLAEATVAVGLVDADAVDARRRVAAGQLLLAMKSDEARRAGTMGPAVVSDQTRSSIVADHRVAGIVLLLAKFALVTWSKKRGR